MLSSQWLIDTALIIVNAVFHVSCLIWLASLINRIGTSATFKPNRKGLILLLGIAVLGLIAIHTTSAWAWAAVYLTVGEFSELSRALYFSVVTSTTLGYGDITLSERWQLLASFEAMGGLVLFGASTAFLLGVTKSWFPNIIRVKQLVARLPVPTFRNTERPVLADCRRFLFVDTVIFFGLLSGVKQTISPDSI